MEACLWITTLAVRSVFNPRIARCRALSRPWSHSTLLFWSWPVWCNAAGTRSSITFAKAGARSVMTSMGSPWTVSAAVKNARCGDVTTLRHVPVDDLPVLVDRPIHVAPYPGDLQIGLVDEPAAAGQMPTRAGRVDQLRREPLHPPVQGHVVDLDATLGEQLLQIPVGQPVAQVPAHRQQDHFRWETEPGEPRRHLNSRSRTRIAFHRATLAFPVSSVNATAPLDCPQAFPATY